MEAQREFGENVEYFQERVCVEWKTLLASCNLKVAIICLNHTVKKSKSYNESHAQYRRHESHLSVPPSIIWQFDFLGGSKPAMITSSRDNLTHGVPLLRHYQFVIFRNQNIFFMKHACCKWPFGINSFPFYFGKTTTRWMHGVISAFAESYYLFIALRKFTGQISPCRVKRGKNIIRLL